MTVTELLASCSFCLKAYTDAGTLVAGPGVYICDECVALCSQLSDVPSKIGQDAATVNHSSRLLQLPVKGRGEGNGQGAPGQGGRSQGPASTARSTISRPVLLPGGVGCHAEESYGYLSGY
jgi:hypothetical protein